MLTIAKFRDLVAGHLQLHPDLVLTDSNADVQTVTRTTAQYWLACWWFRDNTGCIISCIRKSPVNSLDVMCLLQMVAVISCGWICNEDRGHSVSRACHMSRCNSLCITPSVASLPAKYNLKPLKYGNLVLFLTTFITVV